MGHVPPATTTIPPILQGILNEPKWRDDGFEALAFHRGKWVHVKWSKDHNAWSLGYGQAFIVDGGRALHPLPPKPEGAPGFFDDKYGVEAKL